MHQSVAPSRVYGWRVGKGKPLAGERIADGEPGVPDAAGPERPERGAARGEPCHREGPAHHRSPHANPRPYPRPTGAPGRQDDTGSLKGVTAVDHFQVSVTGRATRIRTHFLTATV
ncbi:hypothetical protein GCM10018793_69770 [Streptomyces sulfonofaciens]|uniref:Uncharacterized protein n=1 Tax=Streptomyces sulfonofaciens TaxID=68272 RepID=A0A919GR26_9ACTN|nr:hypothetical protein GCM10018793_69770 [Streptomyces sulfonofaciens]